MHGLGLSSWTWLCVAALSCGAIGIGCGGKAVIDGEPGSGASSPNGGFGGVGPTVGGGGAGGDGGDVRCTVANPFIEVAGDGGLQLYTFAGPDPTLTVPTGALFYPEEGGVVLTVRGCQSQSSTNSCISLAGPSLEVAGTSTPNARYEYTAANGIVFIGDMGFMTLDFLGPVGSNVYGYYEGQVAASGGADTRFVAGQFEVCRGPDVSSP